MHEEFFSANVPTETSEVELYAKKMAKFEDSGSISVLLKFLGNGFCPILLYLK